MKSFLGLAILLVAACVPMTPSSGFMSTAPGAPVAAAGASCQDTLGCYAACEPITEGCMAVCDQRAAPDDVARARAAMTCLAGSGCQDQACMAETCAAEISACTNQPGPTVAAAGATPAAGGGFDLMYRVPAGWAEERSANAITFTFGSAAYHGWEADNPGHKLLVFASQPLRGSLPETYRALWNEIVLGSFVTQQEPGPMRRRLGSGYPMALDGGNMSFKDGRLVFVVFYLLGGADRVVPMIGMYDLGDKTLEPRLREFFDSASIASGPAGGPLFDAAELTGNWDTRSSVIASYVDTSGNYRGDASVHTGETYELGADGSYLTWFLGVGGATGTVKAKSTGQWTIEDDTLVLADHDGTARRIRIFGTRAASATKNEAFRLGPSYAADLMVDLGKPDYGEWYGRKR